MPATEITREDARRILSSSMPTNDAGAATIRQYLVKLLRLVWEHGESFDGKRPFGNSGWETELHDALVREGLIEGSFDEYDALDYGSFDEDQATALIRAAINEMGRPAEVSA